MFRRNLCFVVTISQCGEETLSFWQIASLVIKEGEDSYTTNLCHQRYNKYLEEKGEQSLTSWQEYQSVEQKAHRGRLCKNDGKRTLNIREMREHFCQERARVKRFREEAEEEWQA